MDHGRRAPARVILAFALERIPAADGTSARPWTTVVTIENRSSRARRGTVAGEPAAGWQRDWRADAPADGTPPRVMLPAGRPGHAGRSASVSHAQARNVGPSSCRGPAAATPFYPFHAIRDVSPNRRGGRHARRIRRPRHAGGSNRSRIPSDAASVPRPEWALLGMFELLESFQGRLEVIGAVVLPGAIVLLLLLLPWNRFVARPQAGAEESGSGGARHPVPLIVGIDDSGAAATAPPERTAAGGFPARLPERHGSPRGAKCVRCQRGVSRWPIRLSRPADAAPSRLAGGACRGIQEGDRARCSATTGGRTSCAPRRWPRYGAAPLLRGPQPASPSSHRSHRVAGVRGNMHRVPHDRWRSGGEDGPESLANRPGPRLAPGCAGGPPIPRPSSLMPRCRRLATS